MEAGDRDEGAAPYILHNDTDNAWDLDADDFKRAHQSLLPAESSLSAESLLRNFSSQMDLEWNGDELIRMTLPPGARMGFGMANRGFNSFMFSLSEVDAPSRSVMQKLGYNAAYEVTDIERFSEKVTVALTILLRRDNPGLSLRLIAGEKAADEDQVRWGHRRVEYVDVKPITVTPSTADLLKPGIKPEEWFRKPTRFADESEYRISWVLFNSQGLFGSLTYDAIVIGKQSISETVRRIHASEFVD
jgi:hypothetical protein